MGLVTTQCLNPSTLPSMCYVEPISLASSTINFNFQNNDIYNSPLKNCDYNLSESYFGRSFSLICKDNDFKYPLNVTINNFYTYLYEIQIPSKNEFLVVTAKNEFKDSTYLSKNGQLKFNFDSFSGVAAMNSLYLKTNEWIRNIYGSHLTQEGEFERGFLLRGKRIYGLNDSEEGEFENHQLIRGKSIQEIWGNTLIQEGEFKDLKLINGKIQIIFNRFGVAIEFEYKNEFIRDIPDLFIKTVAGGLLTIDLVITYIGNLLRNT